MLETRTSLPDDAVPERETHDAAPQTTPPPSSGSTSTALWRTRVELADRPGALAGLAETCAAHGVNILALEVLPDVGTVTDELVLAVPESWDLSHVVRLMEDSGARPLLVGRAPMSALADQTVRHLRGIAGLIEQSQTLEQVLADLLDARSEAAAARRSPRRADQHHLVLSVGGRTMDLVREAPFTPTEQARADTVIELAERLADPVTPPEPESADSSGHSAAPSTPLLRRFGDAVLAEVDGRKIGEARLTQVGTRQGVRVFVHPAWRRRGLGSAMLRDVIAIAIEQGVRELDVRLDAHDLAGLRLVLASGLCGSVSCDGEQTRTRLVLGGQAVAG